MAENVKPLLNEALRLARIYWGYSQTEIADHLGVSQSIVSQIESQNRAVTLNILERYADVLDVKLSRLMFFAEELDGIENIPKNKRIFARKVLELLNAIAPREA